MKAADPRDFRYRLSETVNVSDLLGIKHTGAALPVKVQRCGVTHNLGPAARRSAGFWDARYVEEVAERLAEITGAA